MIKKTLQFFFGWGGGEIIDNIPTIYIKKMCI